MQLDIEPKIEKANKTQKIVMNVRGIDAFYVIRLANGKDQSIKFSRKEFENFLPNKKVSEVLKDWEDDFKRSHGEIIEAIAAGVHPTWTKTIKIPHPTIPNMYTGETKEVPMPLDKNMKNALEAEAKRIENKFGKLKLIKIV